MRNDRSGHSGGYVAEMILVFGVSVPRIDQTMTSHVSNAPVDHDDLAVRALVDFPEVAQPNGVVKANLTASLLHLPHVLLSETATA